MKLEEVRLTHRRQLPGIRGAVDILMVPTRDRRGSNVASMELGTNGGPDTVTVTTHEGERFLLSPAAYQVAKELTEAEPEKAAKPKAEAKKDPEPPKGNDDETGTDFEAMTAVELRKLGAKQGVEGASSMRKAELVEALEKLDG